MKTGTFKANLGIFTVWQEKICISHLKCFMKK